MENKYLIQNRILKEYSEAGGIAKFYGFQPIEAPTLKKSDLDETKTFEQNMHGAELASLIRIYFDEKGLSGPQPFTCFTERPFKGGHEKKKKNKMECSITSFGSTKSIIDCLSIMATLAILQNAGYKDIEIRLNSLGDKESSADFERKTASFIRKNWASFPQDLRQNLKKDIFTLSKEVKHDWQPFQQDCPKPIDFLSEYSRIHFKEILEFLEIMGINYAIDHQLIGDPHFGSETIFAFVSEKTGKDALALGTRISRLSKRLGFKKDVSIVNVNIGFKLKKPSRKIKDKNKNPDLFLVQFGPEAKLKSMLVLEELRKTGKSVVHSLAKDKLGSQIIVAENSGASHLILIGQKEAFENSVLLRNVATRSQELVPISEISKRIKAL
ncbi:MAG: His/Gly/Thr/Pro-type tRNA ligase C-terminal domain-containing protein [Patescibacteria group bacterium]